MTQRRHTAPAGKRSGTLLSTCIDNDRTVQRDTVQCVHCQDTSIWVPDSEKWWSICCNCGGLKCGRTVCQKAGCAHKEQVLENMEQGLPWNWAIGFRPARVSVPCLVPRE